MYEVGGRDSLRTRPARCLEECNAEMAIFDGRCMTINRFLVKGAVLGSSVKNGRRRQNLRSQEREVWPTGRKGKRGGGGEGEGGRSVWQK